MLTSNLCNRCCSARPETDQSVKEFDEAAGLNTAADEELGDDDDLEIVGGSVQRNDRCPITMKLVRAYCQLFVIVYLHTTPKQPGLAQHLHMQPTVVTYGNQRQFGHGEPAQCWWHSPRCSLLTADHVILTSFAGLLGNAYHHSSVHLL